MLVRHLFNSFPQQEIHWFQSVDSRFVILQANKYVIITFGALQRKCKHTPLNPLEMCVGPIPELGWSSPPCHTEVHSSPGSAPCVGGENTKTGPKPHKRLGEKQVKRVGSKPLPAPSKSLEKERERDKSNSRIHSKFTYNVLSNTISYLLYKVIRGGY